MVPVTQPSSNAEDTHMSTFLNSVPVWFSYHL